MASLRPSEQKTPNKTGLFIREITLENHITSVRNEINPVEIQTSHGERVYDLLLMGGSLPTSPSVKYRQRNRSIKVFCPPILAPVKATYKCCRMCKCFFLSRRKLVTFPMSPLLKPSTARHGRTE